MSELHELYIEYREAVVNKPLTSNIQKAQFEQFLQRYHEPLELEEGTNHTLLYYAAKYNDDNTIKLVLMKVEPFTHLELKIYFEALEQTLNRRNKIILSMLLKHDADINQPEPDVGYRHIEIIAGNADLELLSMVLSQGAKITDDNDVLNSKIINNVLNSDVEINKKINFMNCLLLFAHLKGVKIDLANFDIPADIASKLVIVKATNEVVTETAGTVPKFQMVFQNRQAFLDKLADLILDYEPLYLAVKSYVELNNASEEYVSLAENLRKLWKNDEKRKNSADSKLFKFAKNMALFKDTPAYAALTDGEKERVEILADELVINVSDLKAQQRI